MSNSKHMSKISKKHFNELINELVCETCTSKYCFVKVFLESLHPEPVILFQLKCIEKFKWEESERKGEDIGWNEAGILWAEQGYAKAFREEFDEDLSINEVYKRTMVHMERT
jgi:hypothetical protein